MNRTQAAQSALLVMYAWDMCDTALRDLAPLPDPRIKNDGWTVRAYLTASDDLIKSGSRIRSAVLGASADAADRVCYGYLAQRPTSDGHGSQFVIAIRGTDGAEEWADDFDFLMTRHPTGGLVDQGFFDIYRTMQAGSSAATQAPVVETVKKLVGSAPVMVLGHSLGAALATYLTLDLNLAGVDASACLFASPRTGNQRFVDTFEQHVVNYDLFNYERDLVPTVPKFDLLHLSRYHALRQQKIIPAGLSNAQVEDCPTCNHHLICYIAMLDPAVYRQALACAQAGQHQDDLTCAQCVKVEPS